MFSVNPVASYDVSVTPIPAVVGAPVPAACMTTSYELAPSSPVQVRVASLKEDAVAVKSVGAIQLGIVSIMKLSI